MLDDVHANEFILIWETHKLSKGVYVFDLATHSARNQNPDDAIPWPVLYYLARFSKQTSIHQQSVAR